MKSIQTKFMVLIIVGILISILAVGGAGTYSFRQAMKADSTDIMSLSCSAKANELNTVFQSIEQSVEIFSQYALDHLDSVERLSKDGDYLKAYTKEMQELGYTLVCETEGAVATYIRFNPDLTHPTAGFFLIRDEENGGFKTFEPTDFSMYEPDDIERVGWYYLPVQAGEAMWMQPYHNENISVEMISYVIPLYADGEVVGIVGMDIDYNYILNHVNGIQLYETGHAFLTDGDLNLIYSLHYSQDASIRDFSEELAKKDINEIKEQEVLYNYVLNGEKRKLALRPLTNGMFLAVTVPEQEISANINVLVGHMIVLTFLICIVFIVVTILITKSIVRPLKELNVAAQEIAAGNLDVAIACNSQDEVGELADSLAETAKQLKKRIDYINNLAYTDKLTGVNNNTAYLHRVSVIKEQMESESVSFGILIVDVNGLKHINDTYGHNYGNELLIETTKILAEVFDYDCIYRIGGDEFAVVLEDLDAAKCDIFKRQLQQAITNHKGQIRICAAIGCAIYDGNTDDGYDSVFKRADANMYERKQNMKKLGENSEVIL